MLEIIGSILLVIIGLAIVATVIRYEIESTKKIQSQKIFF